MAESEITITLRFTATADTPRRRAIDIAERIRNFVAADMDTAGTTVTLGGAFLNYEDAWRAERDASRQRALDGMN